MPRPDAERFVRLLHEDRGFHRSLGADDRRELVDGVRAEVDHLSRLSGRQADADAVERLVAAADEGLRLLAHEGAEAQLAPAVVDGLEAVVIADATRPALFVQDDFVDLDRLPAPERAALAAAEADVRTACAAVGRIELAHRDRYAGTAFVVADDLVATAGHVVRAITRPDGSPVEGAAFHSGREIGDAKSHRRRRVRRVVRSGPAGAPEHTHPDVPDVNLGTLDLALLQLDPAPGPAGEPLPLLLAAASAPSTGSDVRVVGYPGDARSVTPQVYEALFDALPGVKRLAPGLLTREPGSVAHDPCGWYLEHDASTLGGSSGSPLLAPQRSGRAALGVHVAGRHGITNWAHAVWRTPRDFWPG